MCRLIGALSGLFCCLYLSDLSNRSAQAAPPGESATATYQPERLQDPYKPGPVQPQEGPPSQRMAPAGSVQVNVNAMGMNIVGDAANEPTLVIDPTNPQRMAIAWRQFDTVASNFRQGGYAYTTNGGASWTFPGVIEPGVFN